MMHRSLGDYSNMYMRTVLFQLVYTYMCIPRRNYWYWIVITHSTRTKSGPMVLLYVAFEACGLLWKELLREEYFSICSLSHRQQTIRKTDSLSLCVARVDETCAPSTYLLQVSSEGRRTHRASPWRQCQRNATQYRTSVDCQHTIDGTKLPHSNRYLCPS